MRTEWDDPAEVPAPGFDSLPAFVEGWVAVTFRRRVGPAATAARWDPRWWASAEAVTVLAALWRSWEAVRLSADGGAMAGWLVGVGYPLMDRLFSAGGPFAESRAASPPGDPLPCDPPPAGLTFPA